MPQIKTDTPFAHRCQFCNEVAQHTRANLRIDQDTGKTQYRGSYYSCRCFSLTLGLSKSNKHVLNQTEVPTRPEFV